jgi:hypothetical protein
VCSYYYPDTTNKPRLTHVAEQQMPRVQAGKTPRGAQIHRKTTSSSQATVHLAKGRHVPLPELKR